MKIAYTRADGGVSIVIAASKENLHGVIGTVTQREYEQHVVSRSIPSDALDVAKLPDDWTAPDSDRTFRNAWRHVSGTFHVDMPSARNIHRDNIRRVRAIKFKDLDVAYQRADEAANATLKASVAAQKQVLRDLPAHPDIEAASTPDALRVFWPDVLK